MLMERSNFDSLELTTKKTTIKERKKITHTHAHTHIHTYTQERIKSNTHTRTRAHTLILLNALVAPTYLSFYSTRHHINQWWHHFRPTYITTPNVKQNQRIWIRRI